MIQILKAHSTSGAFEPRAVNPSIEGSKLTVLARVPNSLVSQGAVQF